jgi:hypothetical protein
MMERIFHKTVKVIGASAIVPEAHGRAARAVQFPNEGW